MDTQTGAVPSGHIDIPTQQGHTMTRLNQLTTATAPAASQGALHQIESAFGMIPNMFRTVAHSPAALQSMWGAFGALGKGVVSAQLGEQIAVAVANRNACDYCLAAHTALGQKAGLSAETLAHAQVGESSDPKTAAALRFALKVVNERGQVSDADVQQLRAVGFDEQHIVEILAHVALNLFTNYVNVAFKVPVDFPSVATRASRG
jgi:uncharacterized peroxidase-related enzyme